MPAAYQDESGKWYKQCSNSKQLFGGVDTKEELGQWFCQGKNKDGFKSQCKEVDEQYRQENQDKIKERNKRYYQNNSDKIKEQTKQHRQENQDKINEQRKQYRQENQDKIKEQNKRHYQNNPDKIKEQTKQYRQENKDKIREQSKQYRKSAAGLFSHYKKSAKQRGIPYTLPEEWFEEQMKLPQFNICAVSGRTFVDEPNHPHSRTLDRVSSTKGYTPDNVRWVCRVYNSWKSDLKLQEIFEIAKYACEHYNIDPVKYMDSIVYGKDNPHLAAK